MSGEKNSLGVEGLAKEDSGGSGSKAGEFKGLMRWEKFLPKMVLRVLLVEADDSTRQIIAALLRKCSYKGNTTFFYCFFPLISLGWFCFSSLFLLFCEFWLVFVLLFFFFFWYSFHSTWIWELACFFYGQGYIIFIFYFKLVLVCLHYVSLSAQFPILWFATKLFTLI